MKTHDANSLEGRQVKLRRASLASSPLEQRHHHQHQHTKYLQTSVEFPSLNTSTQSFSRQQGSVKLGGGVSSHSATARFNRRLSATQFSHHQQAQSPLLGSVGGGGGGATADALNVSRADTLNTSRSARVREVVMKAKGSVSTFARRWRALSSSRYSRVNLKSKVAEKQRAFADAEIAFTAAKDKVVSEQQRWLREIGGMKEEVPDVVRCCVDVALQLTRGIEDVDGYKDSNRLAYSKWSDARKAMVKKSFAARLQKCDPLLLAPSLLNSLGWYVIPSVLIVLSFLFLFEAGIDRILERLPRALILSTLSLTLEPCTPPA